MCTINHNTLSLPSEIPKEMWSRKVGKQKSKARLEGKLEFKCGHNEIKMLDML